MKMNPLNQGVLIENFIGIGSVTGEMIHTRASELALADGRVPPPITESDYEQARRELAGNPDLSPREAIFPTLPR